MKLNLLPLLLSLLLLSSCGSDSSSTVHSSLEENYTGQAKAKLNISGMECEIRCVSNVTTALEGVDAVTKVEIDFDAEREINYAFVTFDASKTSAIELEKVITNLEYKIEEITVEATEKEEASNYREQPRGSQVYFIPNLFETLANVF